MEPKDSPYYLGNFKSKPTILQVKTNETVITQELPWDVNADDMCQAFYTAMIGITFSPNGVLQAMEDFVKEKRN